MGDVEMPQAFTERQEQAMTLLHQAGAALKREPCTAADVEEAVSHATQALRLADNDSGIKSAANIVLGGCHENQDKWNLAYYEYKAAKEQCGSRWTTELEQIFQYCCCKVFPRE
ncbi:hypothetical protein MY11210_003303 [Beauveria gryllotalpidicola]